MTDLPADRKAELTRLQRWALEVGVVALAVCVVGAFFSPAQFFRAYLVAYLFFLSIAHGCFAILMIYYLTGGAWGFLIRRSLEAAMRTLPLLALLFIPLGCGVGELYDWARPIVVEIGGGVGELYDWARPTAVETSKGLQHKELYLNVPFFWVRAVLYFALWCGTAYLLGSWSREEDRTGDARLGEKLTGLSGPGLVMFGITITFAAVDWVMSLQTAFRSTIIGPLFASGEVLTGMACALLVLAWLVSRPPLADAVSVEALNDLGNLLLTFLIIWAYMAFFQFMLIWIANLPYDAIWYLGRSEDGWQAVAWALLVLHFVVPFFLLLSRDVKRNPRALACLAALILFSHLVYLNYQVLPAFPDTEVYEHWMALVAPLAVGGLWLADFLWQLKRAPVLPLHDANAAAALHYQQLDLEQAAREGEVQHG
jgi:hypothetical protein